MRGFKKIGVVGSGTMGHGIAQTFAAHGYETVVIDVKEEALEVAKKMVASNVQIMLENEFITAEQAANTEKNLSYSTDYSAAADADLVIEAVPEHPEIKATVYAALDQACRPDTVLASTTSAMNVYDVVKVSHPERVLIAHFNNPSHVIPLVEVVAGPETTKELLDDIRALLESIGKAPAVLNKYVPGFIVNRLTAALLRECSYLVDNGLASPEDVDTAFMANQGLKASFEGPLELMDYIGWDVAAGVGQLIYPTLCADTQPSPMAVKMLQAGTLGIKTGKGLKDYSGKTREELNAQRTLNVLKISKTTKEILKNK